MSQFITSSGFSDTLAKAIGFIMNAIIIYFNYVTNKQI